MEFYYKSRELFKKAGFNLRKWASNSAKVNEVARQDGVWNDSEEIKNLGYNWSPKKDIITLKIPSDKCKYTKRGVLKYTNSIFDP